jgi:hypothetical protein
MFRLAHAVVGKRPDHVAVLDRMTAAVGDDSLQLLFQLAELDNLLPHRSQVFLGNAVSTSAGRVRVAAERDQVADGGNVEAEIPRMTDEGEALRSVFSYRRWFPSDRCAALINPICS